MSQREISQCPCKYRAPRLCAPRRVSPDAIPYCKHYYSGRNWTGIYSASRGVIRPFGISRYISPTSARRATPLSGWASSSALSYLVSGTSDAKYRLLTSTDFKSYRGHHVLLFGDSYFTSIIGPNGSGKSNSSVLVECQARDHG